MVSDDVPHGDSILRHRFEVVLPYQRDIAGVCCLEAPGEEGGDGVAADCKRVSLSERRHGSEPRR